MPAADRLIGRDKIRIWDLRTGRECVVDETGISVRGPPSCLTWARQPNDLRDMLLYGTGGGYLVFWHRNEVTVSIDFVLDPKM